MGTAYRGVFAGRGPRTFDNEAKGGALGQRPDLASRHVHIGVKNIPTMPAASVPTKARTIRDSTGDRCRYATTPTGMGRLVPISSDESLGRDVVQTPVLGAVVARRPEGPIRCSRDGVDVRAFEVFGPGFGGRLKARDA